MAVVTRDTSLADSNVGINRTKICLILHLDDARGWTFRSHAQTFQAALVYLVAGSIFYIDGPLTDQLISKAVEFRGKLLAGFIDDLNR